jgi:hypothetical protein
MKINFSEIFFRVFDFEPTQFVRLSSLNMSDNSYLKGKCTVLRDVALSSYNSKEKEE